MVTGRLENKIGNLDDLLVTKESYLEYSRLVDDFMDLTKIDLRELKKYCFDEETDNSMDSDVASPPEIDSFTDDDQKEE